jgi:hypothetical protein
LQAPLQSGMCNLLLQCVGFEVREVVAYRSGFCYCAMKL